MFFFIATLLYVPAAQEKRTLSRIGPPSPSSEGAAIIATIQLIWFADESIYDVEADAGASLAPYILAATPAEVLRRAGLEGTAA